MSPQLDPDAANFLREIEQAGAPSLTSGTPAEGRVAYSAFLKQLGNEPVEVELVEDISIPSSSGSVSARRFRPQSGGMALLVYFHGGGWVLGEVEGFDSLCRLIAAEADVEVLSIDYRLAPENPFPHGFDDAFEATHWADRELRAGRPLYVGGDSSGGNLAAAVSLRARDEGGPDIARQILFNPVLDCDLDTDSYGRLGTGYLLTREDMAWFFHQYVPDASERVDAYVSPLRADSLAGVAPTYLAIGDCDPLYDENIAYARRLEEAGVEVELDVHAGLLHGFMIMPRAIPSTKAVIDETVARISRFVTA